MAYIKINQDKVTPEVAEQLLKICPFNAFEYNDYALSINASCRICRACVKKGPEGVCELVESLKPSIDRDAYKGIVVYVEHHNGQAQQVSWELIGKAKELAKTTKDQVYALLIGGDEHIAHEALCYGADKVFVYDGNRFDHFNTDIYAETVAHFFKKHQNSIFLFGATPLGRSFAPRIAAKLKTGLTADCTALELTNEGDLLQIRPAFGGNIMAKIHTPNHRPQCATIRPKIFSKPQYGIPHGEIVYETIEEVMDSRIKLIEQYPKPEVEDIADADVIVSVGRAFKKQEDLRLVEPLLKALGAKLAGTRPLVENGWIDARQQIGMSGRTVSPKLIINLGVSGAIQYIEGMKNSDLIITVDKDPDCKLFEISHYAIVGDIYDIMPELDQIITSIMENKHVQEN